MLEQKGQLYFDPDSTSLNIELITKMTQEERIAPLYDAALEHFLSITPLITNCRPGELQWLKMEYTVPYFADLIFRCKENVYGIIFCFSEDSRFDFPISLDFSVKACIKNGIIPALLPFNDTTEVVKLVSDKWCLIDAEAYLSNSIIKEIRPDCIQRKERESRPLGKGN